MKLKVILAILLGFSLVIGIGKAEWINYTIFNEDFKKIEVNISLSNTSNVFWFNNTSGFKLYKLEYPPKLKDYWIEEKWKTGDAQNPTWIFKYTPEFYLYAGLSGGTRVNTRLKTKDNVTERIIFFISHNFCDLPASDSECFINFYMNDTLIFNYKMNRTLGSQVENTAIGSWEIKINNGYCEVYNNGELKNNVTCSPGQFVLDVVSRYDAKQSVNVTYFRIDEKIFFINNDFNIHIERDGYKDYNGWEDWNSRENILLYKNDTELYQFCFIVRDNKNNPLSNTTIEVKKEHNGEQFCVGKKLTDISGSACFNLVMNDLYIVTISKSGYQTISGYFQPSIQLTPYYVTLLTSSQLFTFEHPFDTTYYKIVYNVPVYMNRNFSCNFTVVDTSNKIEYFAMNISSNNTQLFFQNVSNANGGTISALFNVSQNKTLDLQFFIKIANQSEFVLTKRLYVINATFGGLFEQLRQFKEKMRQQAGLPEGEIPMSLQLLGVFITMGAGAGLSYFGVPSWLSGLLALILLGFFTYIGWISLSYLILMGLSYIAIILLKNYVGA